jgi:activating signal cointegrator complex subunit 2
MKHRELSEQASADHTLELAPHSTPPQLPTRRNIFDDDEFDQLAVSTSKLHFGRKNPDRTADEILQDRSTAPNKAAILSALAAFDSDDDERDDTYDIEDVGGTVDSANPEDANADVRDAHDEVLFKAYKATPGIFERDAATRRGKERGVLREQTGMTDEALEGWALMLSRDPRHMRRLEAKFSTFAGGQKELAATRWGASPAESGTEESDVDGGNMGRGRGRGRGGPGRGRGNAAGPTGERDTEVARQRKEANKGSRANHNRRDQRARKMARGGFPG